VRLRNRFPKGHCKHRHPQPFSDPPRRLIEAGHGTMTFRFGFCFKVSDKFKVPDLPRLKLFPDKGM
jgi:hypothetical protein